MPRRRPAPPRPRTCHPPMRDPIYRGADRRSARPRKAAPGGLGGIGTGHAQQGFRPRRRAGAAPAVAGRRPAVTLSAAHRRDAPLFEFRAALARTRGAAGGDPRSPGGRVRLRELGNRRARRRDPGGGGPRGAGAPTCGHAGLHLRGDGAGRRTMRLSPLSRRYRRGELDARRRKARRPSGARTHRPRRSGGAVRPAGAAGAVAAVSRAHRHPGRHRRRRELRRPCRASGGVSRRDCGRDQLPRHQGLRDRRGRRGGDARRGAGAAPRRSISA